MKQYKNESVRDSQHLEQKQAERMAGLGYWIVDITNNTLFWSKEVFAIHGLDEQTYKPSLDTAIDFYHPGDKDHALACVSAAIESGESFEFELRIIRADNTVVHIKAKGECELEHGKTVKIFGIFQQIYDDRHSSLIKKALNFQRLLMDANTDLVFVKDADFKIVEANDAFLSVYPPEKRHQVIGYTTLEEYNEEQVNIFLKEDKKAFAEGVSEVIEEIDFPDGITRILLTRKTRFYNDEGEAFILGCSRDITDIKKAEDELIQANGELEEFAYRTSHDLRSPLISSLGVLKIIEKNIMTNTHEKSLDYINIVKRSLAELERLVTDILQLTQTKNNDEQSTLVNITEVVSDSLTKFSEMENFSRLDVQLDFSTDAIVSTKKSRLVLIIENLISNAIKYQDIKKEHSYILISLKQDKKHIELKVADNGLGIPPKYQEALFSMFKRFHPRVSFGSGLGLYMVKKSVQIIGGQISFDGSQCTEFKVLLPIGITTTENASVNDKPAKSK